MLSRWRFAPPAVVVGVCAGFLLLGSAVTSVARLWPAHRRAADGQLIVEVRSGGRTMRIRNATTYAWTGCVVAIQGGLHSRPFALASNGAARLPFETFQKADGTTVERDEDFALAFHSTAMNCVDAAGQVRSADFR